MVAFGAITLHAQETMTVKSPDGKIRGVFTLHDGVLSRNMEYNEPPVIHNSSLGIGRFTDGLHL